MAILPTNSLEIQQEVQTRIANRAEARKKLLEDLANKTRGTRAVFGYLARTGAKNLEIKATTAEVLLRRELTRDNIYNKVAYNSASNFFYELGNWTYEFGKSLPERVSTKVNAVRQAFDTARQRFADSRAERAARLVDNFQVTPEIEAMIPGRADVYIDETFERRPIRFLSLPPLTQIPELGIALSEQQAVRRQEVMSLLETRQQIQEQLGTPAGNVDDLGPVFADLPPVISDQYSPSTPLQPSRTQPLSDI